MGSYTRAQKLGPKELNSEVNRFCPSFEHSIVDAVVSVQKTAYSEKRATELNYTFQYQVIPQKNIFFCVDRLS